jgi:hypothetical protein
MVRYAARGAQPVAFASSSGDSSDSYNGDDVRLYLHGQNEALGHCWEVAQETKHLEAALTASQTSLTTVKGESSVA